MAVLDEIKPILKKVTILAAAQGKSTGFCIGNTRKINETGFYFSPIRNTTKLIAGSVIVYNVDQAEAIARQVDGKVDYVLIDTEKKVSPELYSEHNIGNVERAVREVVQTSRILTYKGNDLTVDSIECLIVRLLTTFPRGLSGKRAAIIGAGNLGTKLALKLVERGMNVVVTRRDQEKLETIVSALNYIKPKETMALVTGTTDNILAAKGVDLLVGLTDGTPAINAEMIDSLMPGAILIDGGKGCFYSAAIKLAEQRGMPIYRADIRPGFEGHVGMVFETERIVEESMGRKNVGGVSIVSGGLLGREDEVVVDNVYSPQVVYGLANGEGDFIRELNVSQIEKIRLVQDYIGSGVVIK